MLFHCQPIICSEIKLPGHEECNEIIFDRVDFFDHVQSLTKDVFAIKVKWQSKFRTAKILRTKAFFNLSYVDKIRKIKAWQTSLMEKYSSETAMVERNEAVGKRAFEFAAFMESV